MAELRLQDWGRFVLSVAAMDGATGISAIFAGLGAVIGWEGGPVTMVPPVLDAAPSVEVLVTSSGAEHVRRVAHEYGEIIWQCTDEVSLKETVDGLLDDPDTIKKAGLMVYREVLAGRVPQLRSASMCAINIANHLGSSYRARFFPKIADGLAIVISVAHLLGPTNTQESADAVPLVDNYDVPLPMFEATIGATRSLVYFAALVDLVLANRPPPRRWLVGVVLDEWIKNQLLFLRLAIVLNPAGSHELDPDLVRRANPIDPHQMLVEHNDQEVTFQRFLARF